MKKFLLMVLCGASCIAGDRVPRQVLQQAPFVIMMGINAAGGVNFVDGKNQKGSDALPKQRLQKNEKRSRQNNRRPGR